MAVESAPAPTLGEAAASWVVSRRMRLGPRDIRYREAGSGEPIVLVHGLGVSADYWVRVGPWLAARGYRVLAPDLPGFGGSPGRAGGLAVRAQADAIRAWALGLGLPPAVYVGHSLSAQSIIEMAAAYPAAVAGIVLAAPTGDGPMLRRLTHQAIGLLRDIPRESLLLASMVGSAYLLAGPLRVLRTWLLGARHDPLPVLERVSAPGIVIVGERDPVVNREFAARIAAALGSRPPIAIPGAAHAVMFDRTGAFNRALADFAAEIHGNSTIAVTSRADPAELDPKLSASSD